jgi:predicted nuclease of predicted toxin-antitoxin system
MILANIPYRLLYVSTGNISNRDLLHLFQSNLTTMINLFTSAIYIELSTENLITHL